MPRESIMISAASGLYVLSDGKANRNLTIDRMRRIHGIIRRIHHILRLVGVKCLKRQI
jgi:hypothetical protein